MHLQDLVDFVRTTVVRTVALIGEARAGKTTLLASIYAMYCKGPFAGKEFVSSTTLVGFAKRHHLALLNSGRAHPTTPHTSRDEPVAFFPSRARGFIRPSSPFGHPRTDRVKPTAPPGPTPTLSKVSRNYGRPIGSASFSTARGSHQKSNVLRTRGSSSK